MKRACLVIAWCLASVVEAQTQVPVADTGYRVPLTDDAAAGAPAREKQATTFRAGVELVALNVVVTDGAEKFITGLEPTDFAVYEDGVQQDVAFFGTSEIGLDLAILLDTSASMTGKLPTAQQAAIGFLDTLRPGDRAAIIDIKDATKVLFPLGEDVDGARTAILATTPLGGTALYNGTYLAIKEMVRQRRDNSEVRRQAIVVLSDGVDTASLLGYDDVMDLAKRSGIAIYTISLRSKFDVKRAASDGRRYYSPSDFSMRALAMETGARAFFPQDISELAGVYASIAEELATQYALGYTSKNPRVDGGYRRVIVQVTAKPGARTRTRAGYLTARAR